MSDPTTLQDIQRALQARTAAQTTLEATLRNLPRATRGQAFQACLDAGMSQSELARILGLSRQRIWQLV